MELELTDNKSRLNFHSRIFIVADYGLKCAAIGTCLNLTEFTQSKHLFLALSLGLFDPKSPGSVT